MAEFSIETNPVITIKLSKEEAQAVEAAISFVFNQLAPSYDGGKNNTSEVLLGNILDKFADLEDQVDLSGYTFEFDEEVDTSDVSYPVKQVTI